MKNGHEGVCGKRDGRDVNVYSGSVVEKGGGDTRYVTPDLSHERESWRSGANIIKTNPGCMLVQGLLVVYGTYCV